MRGYDPRKLDATTIASIGARQQDLQNFQQGTSNIVGIDARNRRTNIDTDQAVAENAQWGRERDYKIRMLMLSVMHDQSPFRFELSLNPVSREIWKKLKL